MYRSVLESLLVMALCRIGYMFIFESEVQQMPMFALFPLYFILVHIKKIFLKLFKA